MNYRELHAQPDGVVFCEDDLPTPAMFVKRESLADDIMVEPVFAMDEGRHRLGWREMDATYLSSLEYHVLSQDERDKAAMMLIGPYAVSA